MPKWIFQKISGDQQGDRLLMKGIFDAYVLRPFFDKRLVFELVSRVNARGNLENVFHRPRLIWLKSIRQVISYLSYNSEITNM